MTTLIKAERGAISVALAETKTNIKQQQALMTQGLGD
jgi:hypothetical protein